MKPNEAANPTLAPRTTAGRKNDPSDEDAPLVPVAPPKVGILPTGLSRAMVIGSLLVVAAGGTVGLLGGRFELISATRSENAIVYRIDRVTGRVSFCSPAECVTVPERAETRD